MNNRVDTSKIVSTLPGYNRKPQYKQKGLWNTDFQSYNPSLAYKVQKRSDGGLFYMIIALIIGMIIAACASTI